MDGNGSIEVSRALRILTQSLFPSFQLAVFPLPGASWTLTRLLAGYMLLYDDQADRNQVLKANRSSRSSHEGSQKHRKSDEKVMKRPETP